MNRCLLFLPLGGLLLSSCIAGTPEPTRKEQALELLRKNDFSGAEKELLALLAEDPGSEELHFALGLAYLGKFVNQLDWIITLAFSLSPDLQALAYRKLNPQGAVTNENDYLNTLIPQALFLFLDPLEKARYHLHQVRSRETALTLEHFYLWFLNENFLDLSGTLRRGDAALLEGLVAMILAPLKLLYAHDLRFDVFLLVHEVLEGGALEGGSARIANLVVQLLNAPEYPNFLELRSEDLNRNGVPDGKEMVGELGEALREGFERLKEAEGWMEQEPGIVLLQKGENGERFLLLKKRVRMDAEGSFSFEASTSTFQDLKIPLSEKTFPAFQRIAANLKGDTSTLLTLGNDLFPVLLPWVVAILSHVNSPTLKAVLSFLGSSPDAMIEILKGFLPDLLYLNPYAYLYDPQGVRAFFPLYRTDLAPRENNFLFEWECPGFFSPSPTAPLGSTSVYPGGRHLTCPDKEDPEFQGRFPEEKFNLEDRAHFSAPEYGGRVSEIAPDGIPSPAPYLPFPDPTFGGVLSLDFSSLYPPSVSPEASGVRAATLRGANAYIAKVATELASLLRSLSR